ncbi:MAG: hypothetical protein ABL986_20230 [Vicinamibacterales bacterium]
MPTVAFIGPDGAGKTTITRMLLDASVVKLKYLYMGVDVPEGGMALPTSRLFRRFKSSAPKTGNAAGRAGASGGRGVRGAVRGFARLANRLSEEWFRQILSWSYQARGFTVLYDRHFALDFAPEITPPGPESLDRRIHNWCLRRMYPLPDLVIFLDAPGALLFARKGELTIEELERRRQGFLTLGKRIPGFVRVDATRPLQEVYAEVTNHILRVCGDTGYRAVGEVAR